MATNFQWLPSRERIHKPTGKPENQFVFVAQGTFLSNNVQMLIDAAPRSANNSHTASDSEVWWN